MRRWASYDDLLEIDKETLSKAISAAGIYCYDAVNLEFEYSSSTSGMYPSWFVKISMGCTVNDVRLRSPQGCGGHINDALVDFTTKMFAFAEEHPHLKEIGKMKGLFK